MLRHCLPASIRQTLDQLPESLDETYLRVLRQIPQTNQEHAHRMLQCLMVAARPLRVEELAELLAFEFDATQGGIPKYRAAWRLDDQTQAVLSTCSSLVTIVYDDSSVGPIVIGSPPGSPMVLPVDSSVGPIVVGSPPSTPMVLPVDPSIGSPVAFSFDFDTNSDAGSNADSDWSRWSRWHDHLPAVVQFSHFSVKEFLMSNRLGGFSQYHIRPASAHAILTQACLGGLLNLDNSMDKNGVESFPLSQYAARHWVEHAHFKDVASRVKGGMETLFDSDKPHFAAWIGIYDMDRPTDYYSLQSLPEETSNLNPLYYSVLCGFYDLVQHLIIKHPQDVNAIGGRYMHPLFAALSKGHLEVTELLLEHGADVHAREGGETILHKVLSQSFPALKYKCLVEVAQMLVRYSADTNSRDDNGKTPLHLLSKGHINEADVIDLARLLLEHDAAVNEQDNDCQTPLHLAVQRDRSKLAVILLEHGADTTTEDIYGRTPLHILPVSESQNDGVDAISLALLLLEHGAEVNKQDKDYQTPLHLAVHRDWSKLAVILLEHGANTTAEDIYGRTPLHILSESQNDGGGVIDLALSLLEHGAGVNRRDKDNRTPLHLAVKRSRPELAVLFLGNGANATAEDIYGRTPLHMLSERQIYFRNSVTIGLEHGRSWLDHAVGTIKRHNLKGDTALVDPDFLGEIKTSEATTVWERGLSGSQAGSSSVSQLLPQHGMESKFDPVQIAETLLDRGVDGGEIPPSRELEGEYHISTH